MKNKKNFGLVICVLFCLLVTFVSSTQLTLDYIFDQKVMVADEQIIVSDNLLHIQFNAEIGINPIVFERENYTTISFSPEYCGYQNCNNVDNYTSYVGLQTHDYDDGDAFGFDKIANYTEKIENGTHYYVINIKDLNNSGRIVFKANYTLNGLVRPTDDDQIGYYLVYASNVRTESIHTIEIMLSPQTRYEVTKEPDNYDANNGLNAYFFKNNADKPISLSFKDKYAEEQQITKEKNSEFCQNILISTLFLGIGILATLGVEYLKKKDTLCENAEIKKYKNHETITIKIRKKN